MSSAEAHPAASGEKVRLFVALDLPEHIRGGLEAWSARELTDPAMRPVRAESLHMTLCFLGWTPADRVEDARSALAAVQPRRVPMRLLAEPVAKPPGRPSLFAVEAVAPEAEALAAEVTSRCLKLGLARDEKRPFWPHVTVARIRAEKAGKGSRRRRPLRVRRLPGALPDALGGEFDAVRLCLYRSMMRRDGSQYVPIHNVDLR